MKKITWVLLIGLWCVPLVMAQTGQRTFFKGDRNEIRELKADGLIINHPTIPINSKVTVTNDKTGQSVEATVVNRSTDKAVEVSSNIWKSLGLDKDSNITVATAQAPPRPRPVQPSPEPVVAQATPENTAATPENNQPSPTPPPVPQPTDLFAAGSSPQQTSQRYVPDADLQRRLTATASLANPQRVYRQPVYIEDPPAPVAPPPPPPPAPVVQPQVIVVPSYNLTVVPVYQTQTTTFQQQQPVMAPPPVPAPPPAPAYQPPPYQPPAPAYPAPAYQPSLPVCDSIPTQTYQPDPVSTVRVSPGYPDPACTKLYTLQVGAYSTANAADKAEALLRNYGFNVSQDLSKPYYRIVISGVQASMVYSLVQRLGAAGVEEVIIR